MTVISSQQALPVGQHGQEGHGSWPAQGVSGMLGTTSLRSAHLKVTLQMGCARSHSKV